MKESYVYKLEKIKIKNYKKSLVEKYNFLDVVEVNWGDDDPDDIAFCKKANNTDYGNYTRFKIYDDELCTYLESDLVKRKAYEMIEKNINIFDGCNKLVFTANYREEDFRIKCDAKKFIVYFDDIDDIDDFPILFDDKHDRVLSVMRLEYELELYLWINK